MVTLHSVFVFCAVASIASAGPCKPGSSISPSLSLSETSSAAFTTETTLLETTTTAPSTTLAESTSTDITVETSLTETSTEAASDTTSAAMVESSTTTFVTCIPDQCVDTIKIQCDVVIYGLVDYVSADDAQACADLCNADDNCQAFTFDYKFNKCYKTGSIEQRVVGPYNGYDTGIKGTCQV
ncbi:hypothetical protein J7337_000049 [Fusarium musae]|uniref:Apple domain-containing protein n=1 Tax=Fusarium musae TaxID=1042133 RepID=A0A9P8DRJ1_9HYPO|nr:hypothetical protein J7337_000049 [Fusarium musae]KAG9506517.1 hypothetical protein J7337_000049 [Fusarium musae]